MTCRVRSLTIGGLAALAATATLSLASGAQAATVTYMSTDVPKTIDDGQTAESRLYGPENLPPVLDLKIVGVQVTATPGPVSHFDKDLYIEAPNGQLAGLLGAAGGCDVLAFNITYDDQAASAFNNGTDCTATATRRPVFGTIARLYEGDEFAPPGINGFWVMTFRDFGDASYNAPPAHLNGWGLRATFAPMSCDASAKKQKLRKKLKVEIKCDADADVRTSGDAKRRRLNAHVGSDTLKVPLKGGARRRLEGGGKAKIKLEASNELGDVVTKKVKVKVTD